MATDSDEQIDSTLDKIKHIQTLQSVQSFCTLMCVGFLTVITGQIVVLITLTSILFVVTVCWFLINYHLDDVALAVKTEQDTYR